MNFLVRIGVFVVRKAVFKVRKAVTRAWKAFFEDQNLVLMSRKACFRTSGGFVRHSAPLVPAKDRSFEDRMGFLEDGEVRLEAREVSLDS